MGAAIPLATSAIGGLFSGFGASKPKTQTSTSESKSTQEGVLDPKQSKVMKAMFQQILAALKLGPTVSQGDRNTMRAQANQDFDTAAAGSEANLAARGMGGGGQTGSALKQLQLGRLKSIQSGEANLQSQAVQRFFQMLGIGQNFITPRTFNTTSSGTQTGSMSGTPWQSSLGSGISDLGSYLYLNRMMQNQGGGGMVPYQPGVAGTGTYGCRIAMELYGPESWKVKVLRAWLVKQAGASWGWWVGFTAYKITGGTVAKIIRTGLLRTSFERMFDRLVVRAMNA